jgi:hypothetical protein
MAAVSACGAEAAGELDAGWDDDVPLVLDEPPVDEQAPRRSDAVQAVAAIGRRPTRTRVTRPMSSLESYDR